MNTDVLIVGAGPTGLALAAQFVRYAVDFVIIDPKEGTIPFSRALGVQARTLEIYEQIAFGETNLAENLIALGAKATKAAFVEGGEIRGTIQLDDLGDGLTEYPYILFAEQGKHEKLLDDFLEANGKNVWWQTELEHFIQDENGVTANVVSKNGERQVIGAKFLVGCDGAKSFVRHTLDLKFEGSTFGRQFYVADVEINWNFAHDSAYICLNANAPTVFFPMLGENRYRIVGTFPEDHEKDENEILYEEVEKQIKADTKLDFDITKVQWFSVYKVHTRHVEKFSSGRCFLAGDAAHIHTPAGAQGMNTGIQDGYNLAWKLALVLREKAGEKLLETYNAERLANAVKLLKTTDRMFNFGANPEKVIAYIRTHIFPYLANFALHLEPVKKFVFPLISQIGIHYHDSPLSVSEGIFKVKAGDRMPYFKIDGASVYERLHEPKFHLLTFFDGTNKFDGNFGNLPPDLIDFQEIPLYPHVAELFGTNQSFGVLLRPDNYIGLITAENPVEQIENYLNKRLR